MKKVRDEKRREFVTERCRQDLNREPTQQELRTLGLITWNAAWDAASRQQCATCNWNALTKDRK
jgi:hypothetical protein